MELKTSLYIPKTANDTANDEFTIGEVDNMKVRASVFSNYIISKLNKNLLFVGKSGDITIEELTKGFKLVDIENTLSELTINIDDLRSIDLNIDNKSLIDIKLPSNEEINQMLKEADEILKLGNPNATSVIHIQCDKCDLNIEE